METSKLFGITAVKKEAEDASSNDDKDIFGSTYSMLLMKHETSLFAVAPDISTDCKLSADQLKRETNIDEDKVFPVTTLYDNGVNKEGCELSSISGLKRRNEEMSKCLNEEMNWNCQHQRPNSAYLFTENDVEKHEVSHAKKKCFECDRCNKKFSRRSDLSNHQRTHTGEKPFECDICEQKFSLRSTLSRHQKTHTGEKPFKCDRCDKRFSRRSHLSNHQRTHTGEKPFQCDRCEKKFSLGSILYRHQRTHDGGKHFECEICKRWFSHSSALSRHRRTHTGEKPFE
ncbi:hypothetical protein QYM36_002083, partial [Artemia franciscana]